MTEDVYYRVHRLISTACGIVFRAGDLSTLEEITEKGIQKLLGFGAITKAIMPPLEVVIPDIVSLKALKAS